MMMDSVAKFHNPVASMCDTMDFQSAGKLHDCSLCQRTFVQSMHDQRARATRGMRRRAVAD
jgi:hypothetical protein